MEMQTPADAAICPHFCNVDEDRLKQLFHKVAKVRADDKDLFDFTHRKIRVYDIQNEETYAEDELYDELHEPRIGNFAMVIEGNVGTGKSELCAYLSHRLQEDGRPVLHIKKNADLISMMAEDIPQFYRDEIGGTLPGANELRELKRDLENNRSTVAAYVVAKAKLTIANRTGKSLEFTDAQRDEFESFIQDKLKRLVKKGEIGKELSFIKPGEIQKQLNFLNIFEKSSPKEVANHWDDAIWNAIRVQYETPSLDKMLKLVGNEFGDNRPVVVFEDFSISSFDAEKLVNYMEEDTPDHNWDFIVAGTQEVTEKLKTQTGLERHSFYRTNKRNTNDVLFLKSESAVDFIRPYLAFIKNEDGSVEFKRNADNEILSLEPPEDSSLCKRCNFCHDSYRDLFPFNDTFLQRLYDGLDREDQRPRQYVQNVFEIIRDYYKQHLEAPSQSEVLGDLDNPNITAGSVYENESIRQLAKWYGKKTEDGFLKVDRHFAVAFGLDDADYESLSILVEDGFLYVPTQNKTNTADTVEIKNGTTKEPKNEIEKKVQNLRGKIDNWRSDPTVDSVSNLNLYLRTGIKDAVKRLTDGFLLQSGGSLEFFVGSEERPYTYEGFETPKQYKFQLDPKDFSPKDLEAVLRFGVQREKTPREANYDMVLSHVGTQLSYYARQWREKVKNETIRREDLFFRKSADHYSFHNFVLGLYGLLLVLDDPLKEVEPKRFAEALYSDCHPSIDQGLKSILEKPFLKKEIEWLNTFIEQAERIESMVTDLYGISSNAVNLPRIRKSLSIQRPLTIVKNLKKGGLRDLPHNLRFDTDVTLRRVGLRARDVLKAIEEQLPEIEELGSMGDILDYLGDVDIENVREYTEKLNQFESVDRKTLERLQEIGKHNQNEIDKIQEGFDLFLNLCVKSEEHNKPHEKLHAKLSGLRIMKHEIVQTLEDLNLENPVNQIDTNFKDISKRYVKK